MEKKSYSMTDNPAHSGGSALQAMQGLPGITVVDNRVQLRGSDRVAILVDGKQTALTGFDNQSGLDNIPASAIDRIEIINNPSSRYDAGGNAGIINIIYKKESRRGFNGKAGLTGGLGALWEKHANLPAIRPQYMATPKINPSLMLGYRKKKVNVFFQGDYLYTRTLNKNEFADRYYIAGDSTIRQQTKRNRNTGFLTLKSGVDLNLTLKDIFTISALYGSEKIIDRGDEPFFNADLTTRYRLWQFLEDELKTTVMATASWQHRFDREGHTLSAGFNYTFHREDEKYFFTNIMPAFTGLDSFKLISDEHVADLNIDYVRPLRRGRLEMGSKFRRRVIPTDMRFFPGLGSAIDVSAGGKATYAETIPALYANLVLESRVMEVEAGLRGEYVDVRYTVDPSHPTYKSDGYSYVLPFPSVRVAFKIDESNRISAFYGRRVDRPGEVDIRVFPKYDDVEIVKVGNPELRPQFTNSVELGYKTSWKRGWLYVALFDRMTDGTMTRIASVAPGSPIIHAIFQNAGQSYVAGGEAAFSQKITGPLTFNINASIYHNRIDAFEVHIKYPVDSDFTVAAEQVTSGNVKLAGLATLPHQTEIQLSGIWLAPDIIPQGRVGGRFSLDAGVKRGVQRGRGEVMLNASDLLNTMRVRKRILGDGFRYTSVDYGETQVIRLGYTYKF
ncbi:TonB-dependent receptor [Bacteroidia bacterium]|nr:TonB-dependent receptor [Bacteroidia bacterium]